MININPPAPAPIGTQGIGGSETTVLTGAVRQLKVTGLQPCGQDSTVIQVAPSVEHCCKLFPTQRLLLVGQTTVPAAPEQDCCSRGLPIGVMPETSLRVNCASQVSDRMQVLVCDPPAQTVQMLQSQLCKQAGRPVGAATVESRSRSLDLLPGLLSGEVSGGEEGGEGGGNGGDTP